MPLVVEMRHPSGFSFRTERYIPMRREVFKESWDEIAGKIKNLRGKRPRARHVANTYRKFSSRRGRIVLKYNRCGNKTKKATTDVKRFLVRTLKELRMTCVCTSTVLQNSLAKEMGIQMSDSYVRKILKGEGYKWLAKRQGRLYSKEDRQARVAWARGVLRLTKAELGKKLSFATDGTVIAMPPTDPTD
eukprot:12406816-Karenia_brevis.AAC.1